MQLFSQDQVGRKDILENLIEVIENNKDWSSSTAAPSNDKSESEHK